MSLSVRGVTTVLSAWHCWVPTAHDLELLPKLMNTPCMLIAWIESNDPDVKEVRSTHFFYFFIFCNTICVCALYLRRLLRAVKPFKKQSFSVKLTLDKSESDSGFRSVGVTDISRVFLFLILFSVQRSGQVARS